MMPAKPEVTDITSLNESPSQKEGKFAGFCCVGSGEVKASMKALPKRKGNSFIDATG